jgi:hypothetical protein
MRNLIAGLGISLILTACSSSTHEFEIKESEVPPNVVSAFKAKYPNAQVTKWQAEKEKGNFYFEAEIKDGDKEKDVMITPDGNSVTEEKD